MDRFNYFQDILYKENINIFTTFKKEPNYLTN